MAKAKKDAPPKVEKKVTPKLMSVEIVTETGKTIYRKKTNKANIDWYKERGCKVKVLEDDNNA